MITATANLDCDECGRTEHEDLEPDQTPESAIDREGWVLTGTMLDRLLCPDCAEAEEA